jgi:hypothetical protein
VMDCRSSLSEIGCSWLMSSCAHVDGCVHRAYSHVGMSFMVVGFLWCALFGGEVFECGGFGHVEYVCADVVGGCVWFAL